MPILNARSAIIITPRRTGSLDHVSFHSPDRFDSRVDEFWKLIGEIWRYHMEDISILLLLRLFLLSFHFISFFFIYYLEVSFKSLLLKVGIRQKEAAHGLTGWILG